MPPIEALTGLKAARYLFRLIAAEEMRLPPYKGSTLRGGFGTAFRLSSCANPDAADCRGCLLVQVCAYAYCFESTLPPDSQVLRSLGEIPRPFVIEPPANEETVIRAGASLDFGLALIGRAIDYFPYFLLSFQRLGEIGLGKGRRHGLGRFKVAGVWSLRPWSGEPPGCLVHDGATGRVNMGAVEIADTAAVAKRINRFRDSTLNTQNSKLQVSFLTMTRLKSEEALARRPEFHILLRALLRRVSSLAYFHGGERLEADFPGLASRARQVRLVGDGTRWRDWTRYSSRQDARMELGGLVGEAEYEGEMGEFLPWLVWGELVHVGKNATFGLGRIRLS